MKDLKYVVFSGLQMSWSVMTLQAAENDILQIFRSVDNAPVKSSVQKIIVATSVLLWHLATISEACRAFLSSAVRSKINPAKRLYSRKYGK